MAGGQQSEGDMERPEREQAPAATADVDLEPAEEPGHGSGKHHGRERHQPDVIEQVDARVVPGRMGKQLRGIGFHGGNPYRDCLVWVAATAAVRFTGLLPKSLLSRNGCERTFGPLGGWKSSTCSA